MKLWRKQAMKYGKRSGRLIKKQTIDLTYSRQVKTYPLLEQLFKRAGFVTQEIVNATV